MNLKPIKNTVIVELVEKEKVSSGGILLAKADPIEVNRAEVLAIGPDVTDIAVGDQVLPNWNLATKTKFETKELYFISADEIVLVFE